MSPRCENTDKIGKSAHGLPSEACPVQLWRGGTWAKKYVNFTGFGLNLSAALSDYLTSRLAADADDFR